MANSNPTRILVVDDDEELREFVITVLREERMEPTFAAEGAEALRLLESHRFDLLLTDIRMPMMDGSELVRRARTLRPDIRVLFMSGYSAQYAIDPERDDFVAKPFRPRELLGCIYEILGRDGSGQPGHEDRP